MKKRIMTQKSLGLAQKSLDMLAATMPVISKTEQTNYIGLSGGDSIYCSNPRIQYLFSAIRDSSSIDLYSLTGGYNSASLGADTVYIGSDTIRVKDVEVRVDSHPTASAILYDKTWASKSIGWDIWIFAPEGTTNRKSIFLNVDSEDRNTIGKYIRRN